MTQLGRRKSDSDEILYLPMFRFGYVMKIHLAKHGDKEKEWKAFVEALFNQESFMGKQKCSTQSIKDQWNTRILKHKNMFGIDNGKQSNLSGLSDEMGALDALIKTILIEIQEEEAKKESLEM